MSFNLLFEPWIRVIDTQGQTREVSLRQAFAQAHEIRRIACDVPTQDFAILRLLLAIEYDAGGCSTLAEVAQLIERGPDVARILPYLDEFADRFDLFHPQRPFMQVANLRTAKGEASGLEKLISDVPNGHPFMTTRGGAGLRVISAADAARWLVHAHAFDPSGIRSGAVGDPHVKGGKGYPIGPGWAGQIGGVVLRGSTLAQTLTLNLVPVKKKEGDRPVWALPQAQTEQRELEPILPGPVAMLAWQSRRIRLIGSRDGVTGVLVAQGDKVTPQNRQGLEHMSAWRYSEPQSKKFGKIVYMPLKHDPARSVWRGLPRLIETTSAQSGGIAATLPSATVINLAQIEDEFGDRGVGLDSILIDTVGITYGTNESTIDDIIHDSLDVRVSLIGSASVEMRALLRDAIEVADTCVWSLGRLAGNIARAGGDFDGVDGAQKQATAQGWAAIDPFARQWIATLDAERDLTTVQCEWEQMLRRLLAERAAALVNAASPAAIIGRQVQGTYLTAAKAEAFFRAALRKALPLAFEQTDKKEKK